MRGTDPGALFYAGLRGGHLVAGQRLTGQAIRDVVHRRAAQAGVEDASPHDLRRSFVSDLLDAGVDIATVAAMAGHANIETTRRYDRRGETAKSARRDPCTCPTPGGACHNSEPGARIRTNVLADLATALVGGIMAL